MATTGRQVRRLGTACDRCYRLKERCTRSCITDVCVRCDRLGVSCATVRPPRLAGRRVRRDRSCDDYPHHPQREDSGPTSSSSSGSQSDSGVGAAQDSQLNTCTWIRDIPNLDEDEKEKLLFLLGRPENLDGYVVSPMFQAAEQRSLAAPLPAALPVLKDAYLACAGALQLSFHHAKDDDGDNDDNDEQRVVDAERKIQVDLLLLHASAAMRTLRSLTVATPQDAALCLRLGVSLALFVYSAVGQGVYEISRHCLSMVKPFIIETDLSSTDPGTDPDTQPWLTSLVLLETMDCLVYRRRPTIRMPTSRAAQSPPRSRRLSGSIASDDGGRFRVDRHLGLCASLLPHYHDLCVVSHSLANTTDASYMALVEAQLGRIQADVEAWQPPVVADIDQFNSTDVVHFLAQARVYRLAALLVGHRLRHKFGEHDGQADIWATEIMTELELARRVTKRPSRWVTLPFVVAAIEMREPVARFRTLRDTAVYVDKFTPVVQKATRLFLSRVWRERDHKLEASWFDSAYKPCALLASLDTAFFSPVGTLS